MKKPDVPSMLEIEAILNDIRDAENILAELKSRLCEMPKKMALELATEEERVNAARYLYWLISEIPTDAITIGLFGTNVGVRKFLGKITGDISCDRCETPMVFRSRSHLKETQKSISSTYTRYAEGYRILCNPCWEDVQALRNREWKQAEAKQQARLKVLATMPYYQYLQSTEWQERRKQHLKSSGYRCQICNAYGVRLNVHHRTYERRGCEYYKDLVTLCEDCHNIFHKEGKLYSG